MKRQYYPVEGSDPYIRLIAPHDEIYINTHYYFNEKNERRFAYTEIHGDMMTPYEVEHPPKGMHVIVDGRGYHE